MVFWMSLYVSLSAIVSAKIHYFIAICYFFSTYSNGVSLPDQPGIDDRLNVRVEFGSHLVSQLEGHHVQQVSSRATDGLRADDATDQLSMFNKNLE